MPFLENNNLFNPIEYLSFCSYYVETYFNDTRITCATAFFYQVNQTLYLVSNWHILSGKSSKADKQGVFQPEVNAAIPNKVKIYTYGWNNDGKISFGQGYTFDIPLLDDHENALFKYKKINENEYLDIACLPISSFIINDEIIHGTPICANTIFPETIKSNYNIHPTDDVFVIGYPFGQIEKLPIWKRASIASASNSSNKVYIDTATKSGMSGSPVFYVTKGNHLSLNGKEYPEERTYKAEFIGIYSGRIIENNKDKNEDAYVKIKDYDLSAAAQLGIFWKKSAIDEIIS